MNKAILSGVVSAGVAVWCAYDLWFAGDPGTTGERALNYFLFAGGLMGIWGAIDMARRAR
jgi:hypothetical protein